MKLPICRKCGKLTGNYKKDLPTCGRCGKVKKIDLVRIYLEEAAIYLTEDTRNKGGRPPILNATQQHDIGYRHRTGESLGKLAEEYGVSKATISNIVNK